MSLFKSDLTRNIAIGFALGAGAMVTFGGAAIADDSAANEGWFEAKAKAKPGSASAVRADSAARGPADLDRYLIAPGE